MPAAKRSVAILSDLALMLDLARGLARDLQKPKDGSDDPGQAELLEALALAQLCAERLLIERTYPRR